MVDGFPHRDHKGLHREFADLEETGDGVIKFVNAYGLLSKHDVESFEGIIKRVRIIKSLITVINDGDRQKAFQLYNHMKAPLVREVIDYGNPDRPLLVSLPINLEGLIWLQARDELVLGRKFKPCKWRECTKWFPVGPGTGSSETRKTFCGDTCRSKWNRHNKPALFG